MRGSFSRFFPPHSIPRRSPSLRLRFFRPFFLTLSRPVFEGLANRFTKIFEIARRFLPELLEADRSLAETLKDLWIEMETVSPRATEAAESTRSEFVFVVGGQLPAGHRHHRQRASGL